MSGTVCGLYAASENAARPQQVVFGFADEFVQLLESRGGLTPPVRYGKTWTRVHDPLIWREAADHLVREAGVQVLFHSTVTGVLLEGERIEGLVAYTKQGTVSVRSKITIDASGDADVLAMAGLPTFVGDENGRVQNPTMIFRLGGVDTERFVRTYGADTIMPEQVSELLRRHHGNGYFLPRAKIWLFTTTRPGELLCNCTRVVGADGRELNTLFAADFTDAEVEGRRQVREYARFFRDHLAGCEKSWVNDTGVQVGVRQTRQGRGTALLSNQDVVKGTKFGRRHCALALADRAARGRKAACRMAARRLLRGSLRLLRSAARRRLALRRALPFRAARGGRLGARHRAMLLVRPCHRPRRRHVRRGRMRAARAQGRRRARPRQRNTRRRPSYDTRASPLPQAPRPYPSAARALLRRRLSAPGKDHSATTGCESCAPRPTS